MTNYNDLVSEVRKRYQKLIEQITNIFLKGNYTALSNDFDIDLNELPEHINLDFDKGFIESNAYYISSTMPNDTTSIKIINFPTGYSEINSYIKHVRIKDTSNNYYSQKITGIEIYLNSSGINIDNNFGSSIYDGQEIIIILGYL